MLKTGIFIRNDDRLIEHIIYLKQKTNLKYVIFRDENFNQQINKFCVENNIVCLCHKEFKNKLENFQIEKLDYIFSYYYQKKLDKEILNYPKQGCINFHPAPLPKYRGVGNYSRCILNGLNYWGVSAHFMDEKYDNGELIEVYTFKINPYNETYISLEEKTVKYMFKLLCRVLENALKNTLNSYSNNDGLNEVSYLSHKKIQTLKMITDKDNTEMIERKIRAFWKPPYHGASIKIDGKQYTIINEKILQELSELYEIYFRRDK